MKDKDISEEFISLKCNLRNKNGVFLLKAPKSFIESYREIVDGEESYIKLMPLSIGNNKKEIKLYIPKHKNTNKLNEIASYLGEIVSK